MRIGMVSYNFWPGKEGGSESQCRRLAHAFAGRGHVCSVYTARRSNRWPRTEMDFGVRIVRLPSLQKLPPDAASDVDALPLRRFRRPGGIAGRMGRLRGDLLASMDIEIFMCALYGQLRAKSLDILHVHSSSSIAGFCAWLGRRRGIPVLIKEPTYPVFSILEPFVIGNGFWDRWRRKACYQAQHAAAAAAMSAQSIDASRIHIIPNGIDMPDLSGRDEDPSLVLYVGNLSQHAYKAFDVLFEAWARVRAQQPGARLAVLGGGDAATWERFLEARGCRDSVSFEGFVRDVNAFYARAAVLVLPSRQEGMSNALIEAQGWGVPAVVSDIPANRAVIDDGVNGLVVPVNDAAALAGGLLRLLGDGGLRVALGAQARRRAGERYALDRVVDRTLEAYEHLLRARNGAGATKDAA